MKGIIPAPKSAVVKEGALDVTGISVRIEERTDRRVTKAAALLCREIENVTGRRSTVTLGETELEIFLEERGEGDAYTLTVADNITARGGAAGLFYAIQTLRQMIRVYGKNIPRCEIKDEPDFAFRGFSNDISRGRVNKLERLKRLADTLAYFKSNALMLYVEDAFAFRELEGIVPAHRALNAEEIVELDEYCRDRFIDLVPTMNTFGHLYSLLQSEKYNHLAELEGHTATMDYWMERQWHHTIDVYNPESIELIGSMIDQYLPLFSSKYFNICCDETLDLCAGKNAGRDKGEAFFHHVDRLIAKVKSHGKTVMMYGDEVMAKPELSKEHLPSDVVIINWCYRKSVNEWIPKFFHDIGFDQIVTPGVSSWEYFVEDIDTSVGNISEFAAHGKKYGAAGVLNTSWGDFGSVCPTNCTMYGTVLGAAKSWNADAPADEEYEKAVSFLAYGTDKVNFADVLRTLGKAQRPCSWFHFVKWKSDNTIGGKDTPLEYEYGTNAEDAIANIGICKKIEKELLPLDDGGVIHDHIISCRAIALMNRLILFYNGVEGYTDAAALQADFDSWLEDYSEAWLRDDKLSDLELLGNYVKCITKVR